MLLEQGQEHSPTLGEGECIIAEHPARTGNGYAIKNNRLLHREALAQKLGRPVQKGMDACHTCDVRDCVNPNHLYEGTRKQNMADCTARGRHNKPRGEAHWCAKVTADQVREMRRLWADGWKQSDLGARYGINPATVSRIVRGIWRTEITA